MEELFEHKGAFVSERLWQDRITALENQTTKTESDQLQATLENAVKKRANNKIALLLSGGVDSSVLALLLKKHRAEFQAPLNRVTILGERLASMAAAEGHSQLLIVLRQMWQAALGFTHLPLRLLYEPGVPLLLPLSASQPPGSRDLQHGPESGKKDLHYIWQEFQGVDPA